MGMGLLPYDSTLKHRSVDGDLQFANFTITVAMIKSMIELRYRYVIIDGEFSDKNARNAVLSAMAHFSIKKVICCCYAPLTLRKERNLKDVEVRQCQAFNLPPSGVFIDTSKPIEEAMAQILPLLKNPEPVASISNSMQRAHSSQ